MRTLFRQNPKEKKYRPRALTRSVGAMDLDRKGELAQFSKWLEFAAKDKSKFPDKEELDKINEDAKKSKSKALGILGVLAAIPLITPMLGNLGNLGLDKINLDGIGDGIKDFTSGLRIPGLPGTSDPSASDPSSGNASSSIPRGIGAMGSATAKKLFGNKRPTKPIKPTSPAPRRRPGVTTSGGRRPGRPDIRNPLRKRPGVTTSGGARPGRPDIRNPLRQRPGVTRGGGGQKGLNKLIKRIFSSKVGLKSVGKFLRPIIKRIPFVGFLIDFALNVFVFKENLGKAAFKAIGAGLGTWIGGGLGTLIPVPFVGNAIGAFLGAQGGDMLGGWIYDQIFGGSQASTKTTAPSDESADDILESVNPQQSTSPSPTLPQERTTTENREKDNIVSATHQETGSGYTVKGLLDYKGRPAIFSKAAAGAFARMMKDSNGAVKGSDIHSSQRSKAFNDSLPGAAPNSNHLYGNAVDIHGTSQAWMRKNGRKYGWVINDYPGSHGGHFNYKGGGSPPSEVDVPQEQRVSSTTPVTTGVRKDMQLAMLSPEAEALNSGVTIIREQAPIQQQPQPGGGMVPVPVPTGGQGGSIIITGPTLDSMYDTQILLRTA
jgi:hypothetical protein